MKKLTSYKCDCNIMTKMLSESLVESDSDNIKYLVDVWFRDEQDNKSKFYDIATLYNINGKVPDDAILLDFTSKIDVKAFVNFILNKPDYNNDAIDYIYLFKQILKNIIL